MPRVPASSRRFVWPVLALAALTLAACSSTGSPWPGIVSDSERAYVAFGQGVYAVHLTNGQEAWRFPVGKPASNQLFYAAPALTASGLVVAGSYDHKVYALNAASGELAWTFAGAQDRIVGSPVASGESIFVPAADGTLFALNSADGVLAWSFHAEGALWSAPVVVGDRIYLGTLTHKLYALDREGKLIWTQDVGGAIASSPSLVDGTLLVGALGQPLVALDPATGAPRWRASGGQSIWAGSVSSDGTAYYGDLGGRLAAVSVADGSILDQVQLDSAITGEPATDASHLYVATEAGTVRSLRLNDLASEWSATLNPVGKLYGPVVLQDNLVMVGVVSRESDVAAFDLATGQQRWTFKPANR